MRGRLDADIERVAEFQNRWATPSQWMSPAASRAMQNASPEPLSPIRGAYTGTKAVKAA